MHPMPLQSHALFRLKGVQLPFAWMVLAIALAAIVFAWYAVRTSQSQTEAVEFDVAAERALGDIIKALDANQKILRRQTTFFSENSAMTSEAWRGHVSRLKSAQTLPGAQGIGFAQVISSDGKAAHIIVIRSKGFPDHDVHSSSGTDLLIPAVYLKSFTGPSLLEPGFNMSAEPRIQNVLNRARDTGNIALSGTLGKTSITTLEGQPWAISLTAKPGLMASRAIKADVMAGVGLVISLLLFWLAQNARRRASHSANALAMNRREVEAQLASVINLANEAIITVDRTHKIASFNPAAEKVFQCPAAEAIGSPLSRFVPNRFKGAKPLELANFKAAGISAYRMDESSMHVALRANGEKFPFTASISRIKINGKELYTLLLRDLTQPASAETIQNARQAQLVRSEEIANFGRYTIHLSRGGCHETNLWSMQMYKILGLDAANNAPATAEYIARYVHPDDQARVRLILEKTLAEKGRAELDYRIQCSDGSIKYLYDAIEFVTHNEGSSTFFGQIHDLTERRRGEAERLEAAAKFQAFVEQLGGIPYVANLESNAGLLYVSRKMEELLGFTSEQWCQDPELRIKQMHPADRDAAREAIKASALNHQGFSIEYRIADRDGEMRWVHDEAHIVTDATGIPLFMQGVILDITERKHAQMELERSHRDLQKMIAMLDSMREDEQKRLAQEMHDDLGQLLAAMKMDLSSLQQRLPKNDQKLAQQVNTLNTLVDTMVTSVRRIIADLPPKVLEDIGLFGALELLVANFQKRHSIESTLDIPQPEPVLDNAIATPIYRIVQEALNNVAKHAQATRVGIKINYRENHLMLQISDDGTGISPDQLRKPGSFGLIGMRERTAALDGKMTINSPCSMGTIIQIVIPNTNTPHTNTPHMQS